MAKGWDNCTFTKGQHKSIKVKSQDRLVIPKVEKYLLGWRLNEPIETKDRNESFHTKNLCQMELNGSAKLFKYF